MGEEEEEEGMVIGHGEKQKLHDSYSYNVFCIGDEDRKKKKKKKVSAEKHAKIDKLMNKSSKSSKSQSSSAHKDKEEDGVGGKVEEDIENEWVCSDYDGQSPPLEGKPAAHIPKLCKFEDEKPKTKTVTEAAMKLMAMARGFNSDDDEEDS